MKFSLVMIAMALLVATVTCHQEADAIVPESEMVETPAPQAKTAVAHVLKKTLKKTKKAAVDVDALEVYKAHMKTRIAKLNQRKKIAVIQTKAALAKQSKAQWATARVQASNKALVKDMKNEFPVLVKTGEEDTELVKYQNIGYGQCVTPPELPSIEDASAAFHAADKEAPATEDVVDSVGAIRTMCSDEIKSKGSARERNEKILVKTQKMEASAKESSSKAESQGTELRMKAEDQERQSKTTAEANIKTSKEASAKTMSTKESSTKQSTATSKESSVKSEATSKVASQQMAAGESKSKASESKSKASEKKEKIDDLAEAHIQARKDCEHAEEKKTVVVKSTDTTIEVKGKHEWQHQELTDKAGVEHSHKEMQQKMDEIIKNAAPKQPVITVRPGLEKSMKAQRHTMEASQKQQETSMKEYMSKEGTQKSGETKDKVAANELVLKSNENAMKHASHDTKPVTNVVVYSNQTSHPTREIAEKLIKENHGLWSTLEKTQKAHDKAVAIPDQEGTVKTLKNEVKELEHKMSITPAPTPIPTPAPTPAPVICHKENTSKHPFRSLEKNVRAIMNLKEGVTKAKQRCKDQADNNEKDAKGSVEGKVKSMTKETMVKKDESYKQLERMQKVLVAAKMTAKEKDQEICDKSRISSETSNKHQTSFWLGLVKELRIKNSQKPKEEGAQAWKNKLCAAVHEDIGMVSGIDRSALLE